MRKFLMIYTLIVATFTSCIENDIPLPVIVPKVTALEVDGATSVVINSDKRTIDITLDEPTDIKRTNIRSLPQCRGILQASTTSRSRSLLR